MNTFFQVRRTGLVLIFIFQGFSCLSQMPTDTELWTGGSLGIKINKKWSADLDQQFRFNNQISSLKQVFTELGAKYKLNKSISFAGNYRFIAKPLNNNRSRLSFNFNYKWKKKDFPLSFKYRSRFQRSVEAVSKNTTGYWRNKISAGYNLSKIVDPFVSYELYFRFKKNEFRVSRFTIGLDWKLNKRMQLTTYFRTQRDINIKAPTRQRIVGLLFSYNTSWKKLTKKKGTVKD